MLFACDPLDNGKAVCLIIDLYPGHNGCVVDGVSLEAHHLREAAPRQERLVEDFLHRSWQLKQADYPAAGQFRDCNAALWSVSPLDEPL